MKNPTTLEEFKTYASLIMQKRFQFKCNRGITHTLSANSIGYKGSIEDLGKRTLGRCSYGKKVIYMSKTYVRLNIENHSKYVIDTLLHEIAHAFTGHVYSDRSINAHGKEWKHIARQIGASPTSSKNLKALGMKTEQAKYTAVCWDCGREYERDRKSKRSSSCSGHGKGFKIEYLLEYKQNY